MPTFLPYANANKHITSGEIDLLSDPLNMLLTTSAYTPDRDTHEFMSVSITNEVTNGNGYTTGGKLIGGKTISTVLDSGAPSWVADTDYEEGDLVRPTVANGSIYVCVLAGTSDSSEPTWGTNLYRETSDGTTIWANVGTSYTMLDCSNIIWTGADFTARKAVLFAQGTIPGTDDYLLAVCDFLIDQVPSNAGQLEIGVHSTGLLRWTAA